MSIGSVDGRLRVILTFGEFQLDTDRFELRRNGQVRNMEPKVFDLVAHFARNPGRVFTRDDLIASVWQDRVVSGAAVSTCIKMRAQGARRQRR